jgi:hypothetical protein
LSRFYKPSFNVEGQEFDEKLAVPVDYESLDRLLVEKVHNDRDTKRNDSLSVKPGGYYSKRENFEIAGAREGIVYQGADLIPLDARAVAEERLGIGDGNIILAFPEILSTMLSKHSHITARRYIIKHGKGLSSDLQSYCNFRLESRFPEE